MIEPLSDQPGKMRIMESSYKTEIPAPPLRYDPIADHKPPKMLRSILEDAYLKELAGFYATCFAESFTRSGHQGFENAALRFKNLVFSLDAWHARACMELHKLGRDV